MKIKTMKSVKPDVFHDFLVEFMWRERGAKNGEQYVICRVTKVYVVFYYLLSI
jgi:hypothetical protein